MNSRRRSGGWVLRLLVACIVASLLSGAARAADSAPGASARSYRDLPEYARLRYETEFQGVTVGFSGDLPRVVDAFHMMLDHPRAAEAFKDLLAEARLAGRLYSLCGLYLEDPATFRAAVEPYRRLRTKVDACLYGCTVQSTEVAALVDLGPKRRDPKTRTGDAQKRDPDKKADPDGGAAGDEDGESIAGLDIVGGGWPELFARSRRYRPVTPERSARGDRVVRAWIQAIAGSTKDPDEDGTLEIARDLGPAAVPGLDRALDREEPSVRAAACSLLGDIGPWAKEAAPDLARRLWDPEIKVRLAAAEALAEMGYWAGAAVPALKKKIEDGSEADEKVGVRGLEVLEASARALALAGPSGASAAAELLTHPSEAVRDAAMEILGGEPGGAVLAAIPAFRRHLEHADKRVRLNAAGILVGLEQESAEARAAAEAAEAVLRRLASDKDPDVAGHAKGLIEDIEGRRKSETRKSSIEEMEFQESPKAVEEKTRTSP